MADLDAVGVTDKGRGHRFEVPEAAAPGEAQDISPCLKGVDHGLLRLPAPIKNAAGEEVRDLKTPSGRHGIQRLYAALLSDGEALPCRIDHGRQLQLRKARLGQDVPDHFLGRRI